VEVKGNLIMDVEQFFKVLYGLVPLIIFMGYVSRFVSLWRLKASSESFSFSTWFVWLASSIISLGYGVTNIEDFLFTLSCLVNTGCILGVMALAYYKRVRFSFVNTVNTEPVINASQST
jgi:hypothetical protein